MLNFVSHYILFLSTFCYELYSRCVLRELRTLWQVIVASCHQRRLLLCVLRLLQSACSSCCCGPAECALPKHNFPVCNFHRYPFVRLLDPVPIHFATTTAQTRPDRQAILGKS